jgi:hypothetical protein
VPTPTPRAKFAGRRQPAVDDPLDAPHERLNP